MKKPAQRDENPFPYSDTNKRYHTFDYWLHHRFGGKCAKISLDAGLTCPNLDGTCGNSGCIYCSGGSSGAQCAGTLREQYDAGVETVLKKWDCRMFIPYLQAHTNTYASVEKLDKLYSEVTTFPGAVMFAVATRADCLSDGVISLLRDFSEKMPVLVELGLQSSNDATAELIGRGHDFAVFTDGYERLRCAGGNIYTCIHIINGLPGEDRATMLKTVTDISALRPDMVKIHLLHVLRGTRLCRMYEDGEYSPMTKEDYVDTTVAQLELLPPETVIARITGDGRADELVAPLWSMKKTAVSNDIDKKMYSDKTWQGRKFNV